MNLKCIKIDFFIFNDFIVDEQFDLNFEFKLKTQNQIFSSYVSVLNNGSYGYLYNDSVEEKNVKLVVSK